MLVKGATVDSFTKEVNSRLAKRPLKTNGPLANRELAFLLKEATVFALAFRGCFTGIVAIV